MFGGNASAPAPGCTACVAALTNNGTGSNNPEDCACAPRASGPRGPRCGGRACHTRAASLPCHTLVPLPAEPRESTAPISNQRRFNRQLCRPGVPRRLRLDKLHSLPPEHLLPGWHPGGPRAWVQPLPAECDKRKHRIERLPGCGGARGTRRAWAGARLAGLGVCGTQAAQLPRTVAPAKSSLCVTLHLALPLLSCPTTQCLCARPGTAFARGTAPAAPAPTTRGPPPGTPVSPRPGASHARRARSRSTARRSAASRLAVRALRGCLLGARPPYKPETTGLDWPLECLLRRPAAYLLLTMRAGTRARPRSAHARVC